MGELDDTTARLLTSRHMLWEPAYEWAVKCLEEGFDSTSLRMLASMNAADSDSEINDMVRRVYNEQHWTEIEPELYLLHDARLLAKEILDGRKNAIDGSMEMYTLLQATDGHDALSSWWDIDEALYDRGRFRKTGEKGYFYTDDEKLVEEIEQSCADLVLQPDKFRGELPETSFALAEAYMKKFLGDQGHPRVVNWVFAEDVLCLKSDKCLVRFPLPREDRKRAKECFDLGKKRNFGLAMYGFCVAGCYGVCCYVMLPLDEHQRQNTLMNPDFIKFSADTIMPEAKTPQSKFRWRVLQLIAQGRETRTPFLIPSRKTLLPAQPSD